VKITRAVLEAMTLDEFRKLHPTVLPEVLEALYDDRLVAFDEENAKCPLCGSAYNKVT
jgi:hypothetical protein